MARPYLDAARAVQASRRADMLPEVEVQTGYLLVTDRPLDTESYPLPHTANTVTRRSRQAAGLLLRWHCLAGCSRKRSTNRHRRSSPRTGGNLRRYRGTGGRGPSTGRQSDGGNVRRRSDAGDLASGSAPRRPASIAVLRSRQRSAHVSAARRRRPRWPETAAAPRIWPTRGGYFAVDLRPGGSRSWPVSGARERRFHRDRPPRRRQAGARHRRRRGRTRCGRTPPSPPNKIFARVDALAAQGNTARRPGSRPDIGDDDRPDGKVGAGVARRRGRDHHGRRSARAGCWSPTPEAARCWCSASTR